MIHSLELVLLPEEAADQSAQMRQAASLLRVPPSRIRLVLRKRSIDARGRQVRIRLFVDAYVDELPAPPVDLSTLYQFRKDVSNAPTVVVIGLGPAGMFAALRLIELGYRPLVIERGKDVRSRRRDLALLNRAGEVDPDSNYCFGEGGAGTYSDGKLYTRSGKRGDIQRILSILVLHGADPSILIDAHPHIGTNRLPQVVQAIRQTILDAGGEIRFSSRLTDLQITEERLRTVTVTSVETGTETELPAQDLILATGHSARDVYELLFRKGVLLEAKPFALGVRVEHPQGIIDAAQYHSPVRSNWLPPASYSLTCQVDDRGVYSFACARVGSSHRPPPRRVKWWSTAGHLPNAITPTRIPAWW